ncbi:hypothetical protein CC99x_001660 [Candidatus Berkiella cookevillensis]|uniref:Uncharacterized protein n=1 Tax=Candidatus Berkiella cookevillensis TaxID=437022 RepID=A0A0Q9YSJ6_9GAMM|nr:hypothetical protein [Candidatus Berkiella cookevillensis]MCS5707604.1 hypothetical protein [Candidatus Berkiella cookevillensis]
MLDFSESTTIQKKRNDCTTRKAGYNAANRGYEKKTMAALVERGYTSEQIAVYYEGYDSFRVSESERKIIKAKVAGNSAAKRGCKRITTEKFSKRNYTPEQIAAYYEGYDSFRISDSERKRIKARAAGYKSVKRGCKKPTTEALSKRGYTPAQIAAYHQGYDGCVVSKAEHKAKTQENRPAIVEFTWIYFSPLKAPEPIVWDYNRGRKSRTEESFAPLNERVSNGRLLFK